MKSFLTVLSLLVGIQSFATSPRPIVPNKYDCTGPGNTEVHYSASSFSGRPLMSVTFQGVAAKIPSLPKIDESSTKMGTILTVEDNHMTLVDGPLVNYHLVLPEIYLGSSGSPIQFDTFVVKTSVAPRAVSGERVVQNNEIVELECTAERVFF